MLRSGSDPALASEVESLVARGRSLEILNASVNGSRGFNELKRAVAGISSATLCSNLRHLQRARLLRREVIPSRPPRVEYHLTDRGLRIVAVIEKRAPG